MLVLKDFVDSYLFILYVIFITKLLSGSYAKKYNDYLFLFSEKAFNEYDVIYLLKNQIYIFPSPQNLLF